MGFRCFLAVAATVVSLAGPARGEEDVRARWASLWRWRTVETPAELGPTLAVTNDGARGFLVLFGRGVARYDASGWTTLGTIEGTGSPLNAVPLGEGAALRTDQGIYYCGGGEPARLLLRRPATDPSHAVSAGDRVLVLRARNVLSLDAVGGVEVLAAVPGPADDLFLDEGGAIWCTGPDAIYHFESGAWSTLPLPPSHRGVTFLRMVRAEGSPLFLPLRRFAAPPLHVSGTTLHPWPPPSGARGIAEAAPTPDGLAGVTHQGALVIRRGDAWVPISTRGLDDGTARHIAAAGDRVLVRTARGRLHLFDAGSRRWELHATFRAGISSMINVITPSVRGGYWIGTDAGVARWTGEEYVDLLTEGAGVSLAAITALMEDDRGHLWVGSGSAFGGVLRYDGETWHHHTGPEGVGDWCVHRICRGQGGDLWFLLLSTQHLPDGQEGGVARLRDGAWRRHTVADGLPSARCYDLQVTADTVMVGTIDGVARLDGERWSRIGAETPFAFSLCALPDGTVFAGAGLEISRVLAYRGTWEPLPSPEGRPLAAASMVWHAGRLWFASRRGLCAYDGEMTHRISDEPGLGFSEFWPLVPLRNDSLLVGAWGYGLVAYTPDDDGAPRTTGVQVHRSDDDTTTVMWSGHDPWETTPPGLLRYRWRLDDGPWSEPSPATEIRLEALEPGTHRFEVQAVDLQGNREIAPVIRSFDVAPPLLGRIEVRLALVAGGVVLLALGVMLERARRERSRNAAELRRFRAILDHAAESIFVVDPKRARFIDVNDAAARTLGYSRAELLRMGPTDVQVTLPDLEAFQAVIRRVRATGSTVHAGQHRRKDGTTFPVEVAIQSGVFLGEEYFVCVARDISERASAEAQLRAAEESLRQAEKLKSLGVLAGGIAHDFNNLLVGILGNADLARCRLPEDSPVVEYLEGIETASRRAADLCRQLLAYAGKGRSIVGPVRLAEVAEEMVRLVRVSIPRAIQIHLELDRNVPAVEADGAQIRQIVLNLMTNAAEAIGEGQGTIRVCTGVATLEGRDLERVGVGAEMKEGAYAYLEVADDGCGMDEETRARIFEPFFTTKFQGRGLGLAAVLGIVRSHHGGLVVESAPGEGTTIRFLLPCPAAVPVEST